MNMLEALKKEHRILAQMAGHEAGCEICKAIQDAETACPKVTIVFANNQYVLTDPYGNEYFQSYNRIIVKSSLKGGIILDGRYWDYSKTTGKYRNKYLGETKQQTLAKIQSGAYQLMDLNRED